MIHKRI